MGDCPNVYRLRNPGEKKSPNLGPLWPEVVHPAFPLPLTVTLARGTARLVLCVSDGNYPGLGRGECARTRGGHTNSPQLFWAAQPDTHFLKQCEVSHASGYRIQRLPTGYPLICLEQSNTDGCPRTTNPKQTTTETHPPSQKKKMPYGAPVVDVIRSSFPFPPTAALAKATAGLVLRISGHPL